MLTARSVWKYVQLSLVGDLPSPAIGYPEDEFIKHLDCVLSDFLARTGLAMSVELVEAKRDQAEYRTPSSISDLKYVLFDQKFLLPSETVSLDILKPDWRHQSGVPLAWTEDASQPRRFAVYPAPMSDGEAVDASAMIGTLGEGTDILEPEGPFYGTVSKIEIPGADIVCSSEFIGTIAHFAYGRKNLLLLGIASPAVRLGALSDPLPYVSESDASYLAMGCLSLLYRGSGELHDPLRAAYASFRYEEGIELARSIGREYLEPHDNA